jgi:hypothetical protein
MDRDDNVASADTLAADAAAAVKTRASEPPPVRAGRRATLLPPGTQVGRYVLAERVGAGGMGVVYRARDPSLDRDIALKLVSSTIDVEGAHARLEREAQAMAKLHHPNVVTVHDIGTHEGQLFIAMELCSSSLSAWLRTAHPWREVVTKFLAAGRGLAAAHAIGLVHRDFKPDNVLIAVDGTVKVSDFGLVHSMVAGGTTDGAIEGTPAYMAPEQLAGERVDARADQFAFAVSVWEAVCGGRPFQPIATEDAVTGLLHSIRSRRRMRAQGAVVPNRIIKILESALEPEPDARWPSLDAMLAALARAASPRRRRWAIFSGIVATAAATATIVIATRRPAFDATTPKKLAVASAALDVAAAQLMTDPDQAGTALMIAYRASNDPMRLVDAARVYFKAKHCVQVIRAVETFASMPHSTVSDEDQAALLDMRTQCDEPYLATDDLDELSRIADRYFYRNDSDAAFTTLKRMRDLDKDPAQRAIYMLRIGDIARDSGRCEIARAAYAKYLEEELRGDEATRDSIHRRGVTCKDKAPD